MDEDFITDLGVAWIRGDFNHVVNTIVDAGDAKGPAIVGELALYFIATYQIHRAKSEITLLTNYLLSR